MTDLFNNSPNDQKKADELINAGHLDIVNRSPLSLVFNEDCVAGMKRFSDKHFDLAIVDPPYGIGQGGEKNHTRGKLAVAKDYHSFNDDKIPSPEYFIELFRVSKNQIIWGGNYFVEHLKNSSCWIVWDKDNGACDFADCELAWTSFDTAVRKFKWKWQGMLQEDMKDKEKRIHHCQKPVQLYEWLLKNYAKSGDKILDTHVGSGSSRIACEKAGLDYVGYEIDTIHFNNQEKRFKDHLVQGRLFNADFC
jgi:site-specific DNA-methyltransferase (adenine-specific)